MSRHYIPAFVPTHTVVVGTDAPMGHFFFDVQDADGESVVLANDPGLYFEMLVSGVHTFSQLKIVVKPYAEIPDHVLIELGKEMRGSAPTNRVVNHIPPAVNP